MLFDGGRGGRLRHYRPADEQGFLAFAKSLHTSKLYELIKDAERVTEITTHRFPTSLWRHYERLAAFHERFPVLGDEIRSVNPIYSQGLGSAGLQGQRLQKLFKERAPHTGPVDD